MSETIKVVMEIPKELYAYHKYGVYGVPLSEVLDKISAEIKERIDKVPMTSFREDGLRDALEVVEKYKKEGTS